MANRMNQYLPDYVSPPGETLIDALEERGMRQKELAERMNRPEKTINEIVKGKNAITPETALQLEKVLGIPANFWIQREAHYQEFLARVREKESLEESIAWLDSLPINQMKRYGWIQTFKDEYDQLNEVLRFFGVASVQGWKSMWLHNQPKAAFRISLSFTNENAAIAAWLRHGEILSRKSEIPNYDQRVFKNNLQKLRKLTREKSGVIKAEIKKLCNEAGVNIIFTPMIPKATISGAVRWVGGKPLIQLSLRGKYNDRFWFTFFHEAGHVLLHGKKEYFLEGTEEGNESQEKEIEADGFASEFLIPNKLYEKFKRERNFSPNGILKFANEIDINSAIIVGRLQNDGLIPQNRFNDMKVKLDIEMD